MRRSLIGSTGPRGDMRPSRSSARRVGGRWLTCLVVLAGLAAPTALSAQTAKAEAGGGEATATQGSATSAMPLAHYIPKDHLLFYLEFAGLDAHAASWNKTAAYRLLTETPLGVMLEEVTTQLLDKGFGSASESRFTGADVVNLVKYVARHGFVVAINTKPTEDTDSIDSVNMTLVVKGGSAKEIRPISSRILGMMMGGKPRIDRKEGRQLVVVPHQETAGADKSKASDWTWWDENGDLVIATPHRTAPDAIIAALDGKTPSATDHPIVQELSKVDGGFDPVSRVFLDVAETPQLKMKNSTTEFFDKVRDAGIQRFDYRWGFDDDAIMSVSRLVAPSRASPSWRSSTSRDSTASR